MDNNPVITPEYSAQQREELGRIDYLLGELRQLCERGMVPPETVAAVEAEKGKRRGELARLGLAAGMVKAARLVPVGAPRDALALAEKARETAPEVLDAWVLSIHLLDRLREFDSAISVCREAVDRHGNEPLRGRLTAMEDEKRRRDRAASIEEATTRARNALNVGDHEAAITACRQILEQAPEHAAVLAMTVQSLHALGRFDEAEVACAALRRVRPSEAAGWSERIRMSRARSGAQETPHRVELKSVVYDELEVVDVAPGPPKSVPIVPSLRWSTITAEFLEEHWQKLILALAVLLIVVSSTVGAALVLGDRLWMAEGKCLLATAYTLMFAGFGHGLARWGAERAGRIMRLTTLMVLPLDFALVGELPGLGRSSGFSLAVLAVDSAAMMALAWFVCRSLGISGGKATPVALITLGMVNALTTRTASFSWGFGAMLAASGILAVASEWLGVWLAARGTPEKPEEDDAPYFAFGLIVLFGLCAIVRIGGYVLGVLPTLYALPAMLTAVAAIRVAEGLRASGHPGRRVALLRLAGYAFSALAFALALARPAGRFPLYSGNTLATAVLGMLLYGRGLWRQRRPVFLYAAFAALFLAYFGTQSFIKDLITPVEGAVGRALGYRGKLPFPFRALNGLVFNILLAGLAMHFTRRWKDDRLARHCHLIGLPLSIAACLLSGLEPLAAVFVMGGYTIAYALATWLFASPPVAYLACAAFTGAAIAASTFLGDLPAGARALALASVGSVLWLVCRVLAMEKIPTAYRQPVVRSARVVAVVALALALWSAWPGSPPSWSAAAALWLLAGFYVLIGLETPRATIAYAAAACGAAAPLLTIRLASARLGGAVGPAAYAACTAAIGFIYQGVSPWLRGIAERYKARTSEDSLATVYPIPLFHLGLVLAALACWFAASHVGALQWGLTSIDLAGIVAAMVLVAGGLAIASARTRQDEWLASLTVLTAACGAIAASLALATARGGAISPSSLTLACSAVSLALVFLGDRIRGRAAGWRALHRRPLLVVSGFAVALAWLFGAQAWEDRYALSGSLGLTALALVLAARQVLIRPVPLLALASGLASWLVGWGALQSRDLEFLPVDGALVLVYLLAVFAALEVAGIVSRGAQTVGIRSAFTVAVPEFAAVAAMLALVLGAVALWTEDFARLTVVLTLASAVFFWIRRFRREAGLVHAGLVLGWLATGSFTCWSIGSRPPGIVLGWLALTSSLDGLICCGLRWWARKRGSGTDVLNPLRDIGILLAVVPFVLVNLDAYPTVVSAFLLLIPALLVSAAMDRSPWRTYLAVVAGVVAAYLTLIELGRGGQGHVSALGVLASLLAILCWAIERRAARRADGEWRDVFVVPVRNAAIALAILAIPFEWDAAGPLLFASLPFLLLIKSLPAAGWLYPALALAVLSGTLRVLDHWGSPALLPWAVASAFAGWGLGLGLWRGKPRLCRLLGLPDDLGYEHPPYHAAMALGAAALGLRLDAILRLGEPWSARPWVPAALAILALIMLKPYPRRGWADGFIGLLSCAVISWCEPGLDSLMAWGLATLALALLWRIVQWAASPAQEAACHRLGIRFIDLGAIVSEWSIGLLAVGALPMFARITAAVLAVALGGPDPLPTTRSTEWWEGVVAILLFGANLDLSGRAVLRDGIRLVPRMTATLLVWWLAIPASPLVVRLGLDPAAILPLATATLALGSGARGARSADWALAGYGFGLSLVAVALTGGRLTTSTTVTLLLATVLQTLLVLRYRNRVITGIGSAFWGLAMISVAHQIAKHFGWDHPPQAASSTALGVLVAALGLVIAGGWDRRQAFGLARVVESFAAAYLALAVLALAGATFERAGSIGPAQALVNVGIMFGVGTLCVVLATRWASLPMAFAAQAAILLGYVAYRSGFPTPPLGDASAMLILAGIELGVAEVVNQGKRRLFALPAMAIGLGLPIVSVLLSLRGGWLDDEPLFVLFAAGTLYAATCGRMRWKSLGYAAAVLYNAALWVFWARAGWRLADAPHLYLVPVGFSTVLFAEANRRELGGAQVNAIRGVGLALIYLALAFPLWQTASLGVWAAVLGISLLAIFAGIGLRSQAFLWLGLAGFVLDVGYQLGRIGRDHALAKWAIMLALGIGLVMFVALNEKRRLVATIRKYVEAVRQWE